MVTEGFHVVEAGAEGPPQPDLEAAAVAGTAVRHWVPEGSCEAGPERGHVHSSGAQQKAPQSSHVRDGQPTRGLEDSLLWVLILVGLTDIP